MLRRLAAIVAVEIAEADEGGRQGPSSSAFRPAAGSHVAATIAASGARLISRNDRSYVVEAASAVAAVRLAFDLVTGAGTKGAAGVAALRVGLDLGDVVDDGAELVGAAVGNAALLMSAAPRGAICVTDMVLHAIAGHIEAAPVGFRDVEAGPRILRGHVISAARDHDLPARGRLPVRGHTASATPRWPLVRTALLTIVLASLAGVGFRFARPAVQAVTSDPARQDLTTDRLQVAPVSELRGASAKAIGGSNTAPTVASDMRDDPQPVGDLRRLERCRAASRGEAVAACSHAVEDNLPTDLAAEAYYRLGRALRDDGRSEAAMEAYGQSLALTPSARAHLHRGIAAYDLRRHGRAIDDFDAAIRLAPGDGEAWNNRAWVRFRMGEPTAALPDAERAVALASTEGYAWDTRGQILEALGDAGGALRDYRQALQLNPALASARAGLKRLGQTAKE